MFEAAQGVAMGGVLYSLKVSALALACALSAATASASVQLDQSDIPETGPIPLFTIQGTGLSGGYVLGQTVTAGLTGSLARVDLMVLASPFGAGQGGFTVSVEKTSGVALATQHRNISDLPTYFASYSALPQFDFSSAGIQLTAGETFNIVLTVDPGTDGGSGGYFYFIGAYDGGHGFFRTLLGDRPYFGDLDQGFRTYVDVAGVTPPGGPGGVPEPSLWAVMILGFGLTGATLRRRRLAA